MNLSGTKDFIESILLKVYLAKTTKLKLVSFI